MKRHTPDTRIGDTVMYCPVCQKQHDKIILVEKDVREALCEDCRNASGGPNDGLHGSDNISVLFPEKPSAAPPIPHPEVIQALEAFALKAASGKFGGIAIIGFEMLGTLDVTITGAIPFRDVVAALEQVKFGVLARDYTAQAMGQQPK